MPRILRRWAAIPVLAAAMVVTSLAAASPAHADAPATVGNTDGDGLNVRQGPNTSSAVVNSVQTGDVIQIACQAYGESVTNTYGFTSNIWDYSTGLGGYVADAYMSTGHDGRIPGIPECDAPGPMAEGFDNSNNNPGTIDFAATGQQYDFAIFKASESTDFVDVLFAERLAQARGHLIVGAYHFFDPRVDGVAQAQHNLQILADAGYDVSDSDTLPIMVDIEPNYVEPGVGFCFDTSAATLNARVADYIAYITAQTGQAPMIYTNGQMKRDCGLNTEPLSDLPLVVPAWSQWVSPEDDPQMVAQALGWDTWTFWQHSSYIDLPGGVGALADRFNGDVDALAALADA